MLVRLAENAGLGLKQTYRHIGKKILFSHIRAKHSNDWVTARKKLRKLRTFLGRVIRDIERKSKTLSDEMRRGIAIAKKILKQRPGSKNKIYSVHALEVNSIAKGKAHKKYEFGSKVSIATTVKDNWVVGLCSFSENPYDGHTIPDVLNQIKRVAGCYPTGAYCDRGYKSSEGHIYSTHVYLIDRMGAAFVCQGHRI